MGRKHKYNCDLSAHWFMALNSVLIEDLLRKDSLQFNEGAFSIECHYLFLEL